MDTPARRGFTLIELLVVLVLLGIATAVVAPALLAPPRDPSDPAHDVVERARRAAIQRAEALTLVPDGAAGWRLVDGAAPAGAGPRLRVSALGACSLEGDGARRYLLDPATCRVRDLEAAP